MTGALRTIRWARSFARGIGQAAYRHVAERQFRHLRRSARERCWCGGTLRSFHWHPSYGVCERCGCYVNRRPPVPEELAGIYSFDTYWHVRQRLKGQPAIERRAPNDRADGRVDYWLGLIRRFHPSAGRVVEVGCGHGVLLEDLQRLGFDCIGVEPDERTARWVRDRLGIDVRSGFFPQVELPQCGLFLAFDVIEHSPEPEVFMRGVAQVLEPDGVAIVQTPIDRYDCRPPFGSRFTSAFDDVEHMFLFTDAAMIELARRAGLRVLDMRERLWLHHEVCVFAK